MTERPGWIIDWPVIAFATALLAVVLIFFRDSYIASDQLFNLIMLVPLTAAIIVFYVVIVIRAVTFGPKIARPRPFADPLSRRVAYLMALFVGYVALIPYTGLEIATFAFISVSLWAQGERGWPLLLAFPAAFAIFVTWGMRHGIDVPIPSLLF